MSDVNTKHPELTAARVAEWQLMSDAADGESAIKARGERYLFKPGGFSGHDDGGKMAYDAYKGRASFPEILTPSLSSMLGIIHAKEIQIELPEAMGYISEAATANGMSLEAFHRRITRNVLLMGRYGVLADAPAGGGEPYLAGYEGPSIINWDEDFFVLDETHQARNGFSWDEVEQYRVLSLSDGGYVQTVHVGEAAEDVTPTMQGGGALDRVPFTVANAIDVSTELKTPPLIGIARAALSIYQLDADYRHQLFLSGQETLIAKNCDPPAFVGAGAVHTIKGERDREPDVFYVSPTCAGIEAHKEAKKEYAEAAAQAGARLHRQEKQAQESGDARRLRHKSETATLMSVAQTSCALLEKSLRNIALMKGLNEDDVIVTPPADLMDTTMSPQDAAALMGVYADGGMSWQTYYENLQRGGIASAERTHDEEYGLIEGRDLRVSEGDAL